MAEPALVLRGENVALRVFVNNQPQTVQDLVKSFKVEEQAVMHRDQYLGRNRARTDKQVDGFDVSIEADFANTALLDALQAQEAAREANLPVPTITIGFQLVQRDGTLKAYAVDRLQAKYGLNVGGRTDSVGQTIELQGENLVAIV